MSANFRPIRALWNTTALSPETDLARGRCILGRLGNVWPGLPLSVRESNRVPFSESGCISTLSLWDPDPAGGFRAFRFWSRKQGPIYGHQPPSYGHLGLVNESRAFGALVSDTWAQVTGTWPRVPASELWASGPGLLATCQMTLYGPQRVTESHLDLLESQGLGNRTFASVSL